MQEFLATLTNILRDIHPESYYQINPNKQISYPYLTFDIDSDWLERNQLGINLTIDIFGSGSSPKSVIALEEKLKEALIYKRELTNDFGMIFSMQNAQTLPTLVDNLHRRNINFYIKLDERSIQYGTT